MEFSYQYDENAQFLVEKSGNLEYHYTYDALGNMLSGAAWGAVAGAAFEGLSAIKGGIKTKIENSKGGSKSELFLPDEYYQKLDNNIAKAIEARDAEVARIQALSNTQQSNYTTVVGGVDLRTGEIIPVCERCQTKYPINQFVKGTQFKK